MDPNQMVSFELQIETKVFEQLFQENQHFRDSYHKLLDATKQTQTLKNENLALKQQLETLKAENLKLKFENNNQCEQSEKNLHEKIKRLEAENRQLDKHNLNLESQIRKLNLKLRLQEEGDKSNDLAQVECKLLKLKLQTLENEKKYLVEDFEKERKIISKQGKPRVAKIEENIKSLMKYIDEARERRPHDSDEIKALKAQIQTLENDKRNLLEGFELERKVFQKILKNSP